MTFRIKIVPGFFLLTAFFSLLGVAPLFADPSLQVAPGEPLYQRVKALEAYGLLDPQDQAVLDQGRIVTRLELAFYTEKAKEKLKSNTTPANGTPTPQSSSLPLPLAPKAPPNPTVAAEIDSLLKELDEEADYLNTRLALDDYRIQQQEDELQKLNDAQDQINAEFRKANKSSSNPRFTSIADIRVENLGLSGITQVAATSVKNEENLGVWGDLGGVGSFSMGLGTYIYSSVTATPSQPASIYLFSPTVNFNMNGMLGSWSNTIAVEDYTSDVDMGDFTRGAYPGQLRFEDPFDIKRYSTDKNTKNWDDYMNNLGYVPSYNSWITQNQSAKVFDGLYMLGTHLPLVSQDAKATILVGRMGPSGADTTPGAISLNDFLSSPGETTGSYTQRWEEGIKYTQPWPGGIQTSFSTIWVNDNFGVAQGATIINSGVTTVEPGGQPAMDLRDYAADIAIDLKPAFLDLEGGFSHLYTGYFSGNSAAVTGFQANTGTPQALEAPAGQASLNIYPLTLYYTAISDGYANFQSKVILTGIQFWKYGFYNGYPTALYNNGTAMNDQFGFVGMVDDLISDRYGWRANLGWKGRQESWTKSLPDFLDDVVINFDVAQKTEYTVVADETGYYDVEPYNLISVLYPDDTGLFGGAVWDGFSGIHPGGEQYVNNIEAARNDANWSGTAANDYAYVLRFAGIDSERIPMILPISAPVSAGGQPIPVGAPPVTSGGHNLYVNLDDLKTYNYITLTAKLQFSKMFQLPTPLYGSFFFTDHGVSGTTTDPAVAGLSDPNRPGQTLANIPDMFHQTAYDAALMCGVVRNLNFLADYGLEFWRSNYTYPLVDYRTDALGAGFAYDLPWGGGKFEFRYKHITFQDAYLPANNYQANQYYSYFLFEF